MSRSIYAITGRDRHEFLQGLVTNDIKGLSDGLVYAALLTPQGKYLADFFLFEDGETILLDVAEVVAATLIQRLSMYKLRADVAITPTDLQVSRGTGPIPEGAKTDPRHAALGWRLYGQTPEDDDTDWEELRVMYCIPETGIELGPDTYILEAGFERLNGVDFRKGCYVGQEVTARMKHKTELRKGLTKVDISGAAPVGAKIMSADKEAGILYTQANGQAIAYLRFDRATAPMTVADATIRISQD